MALSDLQKQSIDSTIDISLEALAETSDCPFHIREGALKIILELIENPDGLNFEEIISTKKVELARYQLDDALEMLEKIIRHPNPQNRAESYPHVFNPEPEKIAIFHLDLDKKDHGIIISQDPLGLKLKDGTIIVADDLISPRFYNGQINLERMGSDRITIIAKEPLGLLSLTSRGQVTRAEVLTYLKTKVSESLEQVELAKKGALKLEEELKPHVAILHKAYYVSPTEREWFEISKLRNDLNTANEFATALKEKLLLVIPEAKTVYDIFQKFDDIKKSQMQLQERAQSEKLQADKALLELNPQLLSAEQNFKTYEDEKLGSIFKGSDFDKKEIINFLELHGHTIIEKSSNSLDKTKFSLHAVNNSKLIANVIVDIMNVDANSAQKVALIEFCKELKDKKSNYLTQRSAVKKLQGEIKIQKGITKVSPILETNDSDERCYQVSLGWLKAIKDSEFKKAQEIFDEPGSKIHLNIHDMNGHGALYYLSKAYLDPRKSEHALTLLLTFIRNADDVIPCNAQDKELIAKLPVELGKAISLPKKNRASTINQFLETAFEKNLRAGLKTEGFNLDSLKKQYALCNTAPIIEKIRNELNNAYSIYLYQGGVFQQEERQSDQFYKTLYQRINSFPDMEAQKKSAIGTALFVAQRCVMGDPNYVNQREAIQSRLNRLGIPNELQKLETTKKLLESNIETEFKKISKIAVEVQSTENILLLREKYGSDVVIEFPGTIRDLRTTAQISGMESLVDAAIANHNKKLSDANAAKKPPQSTSVNCNSFFQTAQSSPPVSHAEPAISSTRLTELLSKYEEYKKSEVFSVGSPGPEIAALRDLVKNNPKEKKYTLAEITTAIKETKNVTGRELSGDDKKNNDRRLNIMKNLEVVTGRSNKTDRVLCDIVQEFRSISPGAPSVQERKKSA